MPRRTSATRTCVGCRERTPQAELLRIVASVGPAGSLALPDRDRRQPGRGAYVHPTRHCLELAERRRALSRALRVLEPVDLRAVVDEVEQWRGC